MTGIALRPPVVVIAVAMAMMDDMCVAIVMDDMYAMVVVDDIWVAMAVGVAMAVVDDGVGKAIVRPNHRRNWRCWWA